MNGFKRSAALLAGFLAAVVIAATTAQAAPSAESPARQVTTAQTIDIGTPTSTTAPLPESDKQKIKRLESENAKLKASAKVLRADNARMTRDLVAAKEKIRYQKKMIAVQKVEIHRLRAACRD